MRFLFGINFCFRFNTRICKELLRFRAGLSATAMVAPVDFLWHVAFQSVIGEMSIRRLTSGRTMRQMATDKHCHN